MLRKIICFSLCVAFIMSFALTTFAANEPFYFRLQGEYVKRMHAFLNTYNVKVIEDDNATIATTYNEAPGYGYYLRLGTRIGTTSTLGYATKGYWFSGKTLRYPAYEEGKAVVGQKYYIEGRVDNDYTDTYLVEGLFNADEVVINLN